MCLQCTDQAAAPSCSTEYQPGRTTFDQATLRQNELRANGEPVLPVKVTAHYRQLIDHEINELGSPGGPLYCAAYPKPGRFTINAPGEVANYVQDEAHMPAGLRDVIIHRYPAKLLFLATPHCVGHCQYCFRPDVVGGAAEPGESRHRDNLAPAVVQKVCDYLAANPQVREVIISGGDPLACDVSRLAEAVRRLSEVSTVQWFRLHTRACAYDPDRLSDRFVRLCAQHRIRLVHHLVHPYEVDRLAAEKLQKLRAEGVAMYNQFPLVRGINDHPAVVMELAYTCAEAGVQVLSMFSPDPVRYGAVYRVPMRRVYAIADEVFRRGEAWISNFRVCQDTPIGKVKPEHLVYADTANHRMVYRRDGQTVHFPDLPEELDQPTPLDTLLYRGARYTDLSPWL